MKYATAQHSLIGAREQNQDRLAIVEAPRRVLLVLADGLGGYRGGDMAAETMVDTISQLFHRMREPAISNPFEFIALAIQYSHRRINNRAGKVPDDAAPRTTCVATVIQDGYAYWGHVGDSRLYHFRGGRLRSRTRDHSTRERNRGSNGPPHLLRCVGGPVRPTVEFGRETRLMPGDALLLCSDGLSNLRGDDSLGMMVVKEDLDDATEDMLLDAEASDPTGCDNMSAIVFRWEDRLTTAPPPECQPLDSIAQEQAWKLERDRRRAHSKSSADTGRPGDSPLDREIAQLEAFMRSVEEFGADSK
ncbi:MAG: protein phosphatase 2C domain-containing protein [Gammaproteobacteria bacterium]|nr:protein phosphatase 2C domain-containing protein [Gammaproteobacteria bacterium]